MNKYDWSNVPKWCGYIAKHKNGRYYGFDQKPFIGIHGWTMNPMDECRELKIKSIFQGNWQDSLEERPND
jgi:hypothetical protein